MFQNNSYSVIFCPPISKGIYLFYCFKRCMGFCRVKPMPFNIVNDYYLAERPALNVVFDLIGKWESIAA